jgi:UDP-N-acetylglucosamine--N-acetylmuramyl-(pentapeptide) pyrophosphoryl-undecaprenol N-acetylglucosamine transferase
LADPLDSPNYDRTITTVTVPASLKLLIAASGTGGHLFPGLAVAEKLPECDIEWLGVPNRLETKLVPDRYPLNIIEVGGFQGKPGINTLKTAWRLIASVFKTRSILKKGKFQAVFTTGGYISAPAILAARSLGLPVVLHESNALPGKVTRFFGKFCTKVAVGFAATQKHLPKANTVYLGTPVRQQFTTPEPLDLEIPIDVPVLAIVGGSQGAAGINKIVQECIPGWLEAGIFVVHITGERDNLSDGQSQHPHYITLPFYNNIAGLFQRANLVISRAGAATLTEIIFCRIPSILIPYPHAAEDHQFHNANELAGTGAALVFRQEKLTSHFLSKEVSNLLNSPKRLQTMSYNCSSLGVINSADLLADLMYSVSNKPLNGDRLSPVN